jgi:hypothetical protein
MKRKNMDIDITLGKRNKIKKQYFSRLTFNLSKSIYNLESYLLQFICIEELNTIYQVFNRSCNLKLSKENYKQSLESYFKECIINKSIAELAFAYNHRCLNNLKSNYHLPLLGFYSDGGINNKYQDTDSAPYEMENSNYNNLFYLNRFNPSFKTNNLMNVNILAGIPYDFNTLVYYDLIKTLEFKKSYIEQYRSQNHELFKILEQNNINFTDFHYAFLISQVFYMIWANRFMADEEDSELAAELCPDIDEDELPDIVARFPFFQKIKYFRFDYDGKDLDTPQYDIFENFNRSSLAFLIRSIKFINSRFSREFVIFISDQKFEDLSDYRKLNLKEIQEYEMLLTSSMENILINDKDNALQFDLTNKDFNYIEFRLDCYKENKLKPLLYVRTLNDIVFFEIALHQYFLGKWIMIKYIKNKELLELPIDITEHEEEESDETDEDDENLDSWANADLPKMFFYGCIFNT